MYQYVGNAPLALVTERYACKLPWKQKGIVAKATRIAHVHVACVHVHVLYGTVGGAYGVRLYASYAYRTTIYRERALRVSPDHRLTEHTVVVQYIYVSESTNQRLRDS